MTGNEFLKRCMTGSIKAATVQFKLFHMRYGEPGCQLELHCLTSCWYETKSQWRNKKKNMWPRGMLLTKRHWIYPALCTASMETTIDLLPLVLFITLLDSSQRTLYRMSPGSFIRWLFSVPPFKKKRIIVLILFLSSQKFSYEAKGFNLNHNSPKQISFKRFNSAALKPTWTDS